MNYSLIFPKKKTQLIILVVAEF